MLNISELIHDPDFVQEQMITVYRQFGKWVKGKWTAGALVNGTFVEGAELTLQVAGVIIPASIQDIEQIPESDRVRTLMSFYTTSDFPIYTTHVAATEQGPNGGTSDQILWKNERYRIFQVNPYSDYGYWKAIGARMAGA